MASALDNILQRPQPPPGSRPQTVRGEGPSPPTTLRRVSMSLSAGPGERPLTARPRLASSANLLENVPRASQQSAGPVADAERLERLSSRSCSPIRPPGMEPSRRGSFKLSSAGAGGAIPPQLPLRVAPAAKSSDRFSSFAQSHYPRMSKTEQLRTAVASGNTLAPQDGALDCSSHTVPKSSARLSTSKRGSLFSRQSVADIVAEVRAKDQLREHERKEHEDTAQVAANRQNSDCWQSDDAKLTCDQRLTAAASSAAAERIGRISLARTRSRSSSPKRTPYGSLNSARTPSTDDTALNDANQLDRIAQSDEEYRRQRSLIRKALREFRPSDDDWLDIYYIL